MSGKYPLKKVVLLLLLFIIPDASASSTSDIVKRVNDLNYPALYSMYPELKNIQSQTVSSLQGRTILDQETSDYVEIVIKIINTFNEMLSLSETDSLESHEAAITKAENLKFDIEALESYNEPKEKYYPLLARISLKNFYKKEAQYFADKEKNEQKTDLKIKYELNEARIYKNIGDPKYAEISFRAEKEKSEYEHDINFIKETIRNSTDFYSYTLGINSLDFSSSLEMYGTSFKLEESITNANQLSSFHEEEKLKKEGEDLLGNIREIKAKAATTVINSAMTICIAYILVSLFFSFSIMRWKNEVDNVDLGNDLLEGLALD